jgi:hypothetical protein
MVKQADESTPVLYPDKPLDNRCEENLTRVSGESMR